MYILITGVAGFIGSALAMKLLDRGDKIFGIDNLNNYYDVELKKKRLFQCSNYSNFKFQILNIADRENIKKLFYGNNFDIVIHLAAQPGVRYSIEHPAIYVDSNLVGFANILEGCRHIHIRHLVFASSSSVYGANTKLPFSEHDSADHPLALYAATKRANELLAHSYAHLFHLPCTGLRFFTVYGPWGRPDMALFKFTRNILENKPIPVYNHGRMKRDFTYIDDIVEGIIRVIEHPPQNPKQPLLKKLDPAISSCAPYRIYNIGNGYPVELKYFIEVLGNYLKKKAHLDMLEMQDGDVLNTYASTKDFEKAFGKLPHTSVEVGVAKFVEWYKTYYSLK